MDINRLSKQCDGKTPVEILSLAIENFPNIAIAFSGAEDVVLIDMAVKIKADIRIFSLDTGRLHPETYRFIEKIREYYGIKIDLLSPDHNELEQFVRNKGLYSFYQDGHQQCCEIRKVAPLRRALSGLDAWVTGQRQDQSPDTRQDVAVMQKDDKFSSANKTLVKFNPLSLCSSGDVWQYIRENKVPYNELHTRGFISIGCEPCTRAILPGQHEREGRWWWEAATKKECGLHFNKTE